MNVIDISELVPDDLNLNTGTVEGVELMEKSLSELGAGRSVLLDSNNRIIAGNKTTEAAAAAGISKVIVVETTGDELVAVKRVDIDLDTKKGREMALADNAASALNLSWNSDNLRRVAKKFDVKPPEWGVELKGIFGNSDEPVLCDLKDAPTLSKNGEFYVVSFWRVSDSDEGEELSKIKANPDMVRVFADTAAGFVGRVCGRNLRAGGWCLITAPKRRHKEHNFAVEVCKSIASQLDFPFYEDVFTAKDRSRINPVFTLTREIRERNVVVFDDIVTTGSTFTAMHNALKSEKNMVFFAGIRN